MQSGAGTCCQMPRNCNFRWVRSLASDNIEKPGLIREIDTKSNYMTFKENIFKIRQQITDLDRNYFHDHAITLTRRSTEPKERLMVCLLAFAIHADQTLFLRNSPYQEGEPDLWQAGETGAIDLWINVGFPAENLIRKACDRATRVIIYTYGGKVAHEWWDQHSDTLEQLTNLTIINLPFVTSKALARLAQRNMQLTCTINGGQIWLDNQHDTVQVELTLLKMGTSPNPD